MTEVQQLRFPRGWRYTGPEDEQDAWRERLSLLLRAGENLRQAGYRELARRVEDEFIAERERLAIYWGDE